jgi:hypothetical protein
MRMDSISPSIHHFNVILRTLMRVCHGDSTYGHIQTLLGTMRDGGPERNVATYNHLLGYYWRTGRLEVR